MTATEAVLRVTGLTKHYGQRQVLRGVDIEVYPGEIVGLLGPNGAGKTTTLEIMLGLTAASSGSVELFGSPATYPLDESIKTRLGTAFQSTGLYEDLTVKETCRLFAALYPRHRSLPELLHQVDLVEQQHQRLKHLSGGQQQRLIVALSIINDPDIIFLDEPTIGLDPRNRRDIWQLIEQLKDHDKTVILTSHYMDEIERLCDRIFFLHHGTIIAAGSIEDIRQQLGKRAESLEDMIIELEEL